MAEQIPANVPRDPLTTLRETLLIDGTTLKVVTPVVAELAGMGAEFRLEIGEEPTVEYVKVTDVAGAAAGDFVIARAAEDAALRPAREWPADTPVRMGVTKGGLQTLLAESEAKLASANVPAFASPADDGLSLAWATGDIWAKVRHATQDYVDVLVGQIYDDLTFSYDTLTAMINDGLALKQPLDSDLSIIAGLSPANDSILQRKGGVWSGRTIAQLQADFTAIDALKIGAGLVDNTEFGYLNGVTSGIQAQFAGTVKTTTNQNVAGIKTFTGLMKTSNGYLQASVDPNTYLLVADHYAVLASGNVGLFLDGSNETVGLNGALILGAGGVALSPSYLTLSTDLTLTPYDQPWQILNPVAAGLTAYLPFPALTGVAEWRVTNVNNTESIDVDGDPLDPNLVVPMHGGPVTLAPNETAHFALDFTTPEWRRIT